MALSQDNHKHCHPKRSRRISLRLTANIVILSEAEGSHAFRWVLTIPIKSLTNQTAPNTYPAH